MSKSSPSQQRLSISLELILDTELCLFSERTRMQRDEKHQCSPNFKPSSITSPTIKQASLRIQALSLVEVSGACGHAPPLLRWFHRRIKVLASKFLGRRRQNHFASVTVRPMCREQIRHVVSFASECDCACMVKLAESVFSMFIRSSRRTNYGIDLHGGCRYITVCSSCSKQEKTRPTCAFMQLSFVGQRRDFCLQ